MKRLAWLTAWVLATGLGLLLLWQFRAVVLLFLLSLMVAASVRPLIDRLTEAGFPRTIALLAVYLVGVVIAGAWLYAAGAAALEELERGGNQFVAAYDRLWAEWPEGTRVQQVLIQWLPRPEALYRNLASEQMGILLPSLLGITLSVVDVFSQVLAVVMLSLYWSVDRVRFERLWLSLLAAPERARARDIWREIETGMGVYLRSELTQSFLAGLLLGAGYSVMGLPYPTWLGLWAMVAWLVPWLGPLLALIPVVPLALGISPGTVALAASLVAIVFLFLRRFIAPRLIHRRYSSLLVVLVMIALADLFGVVGVVFALPLAAAVQILFSQFTRSAALPASSELAHEMESLEDRLAAVGALLDNDGSQVEVQNAHLMQRLTELLKKARSGLQLNDVVEKPADQPVSR
ncbi:MAG: AI-2E family transporter [Anaerolineales bacterium]